jgi:tRNA (adenine37-N6)-methyltransferase
MGQVALNPVGVVHTKATSDEIKKRVPGIESIVEIFSEFEPALDGLDGFSHIFVLGYLHELRPDQIGLLKVKPRGLLNAGLSLDELPTIGVFALDSPTRPNPIGLSLVPLVKRMGRELVVSGLDFFEGTPVLDIKPYQGIYRAEQYKVPEWHAKILKKAGHV